MELEAAARPTSRRTRRRTSRASSRATRPATTRSRTATCPTAARPPRSSTGINAGGARADRPADAEPAARLDGRARARSPVEVPELAFAVLDAAPRRARRGADARRSRCASTRPGGRRSARCCSTCSCRSPRAGGATTRRRTSGCSSCSARSRTGARRCATLLWTRTTLVVPPFTGSTVVELPVPCSYDMDVLASRYLDALAGGEVPLEFLFSGTRVLRGRRRAAAGGADLVGAATPSTGCRCASGARRWSATSRARAWLRLPQGQLRPAVRVQGAPRARRAGSRPSTRCSGSAEWTRCARSPTRCSTRATCCGPTAARRRRTSAAGRSAASTRARTPSAIPTTAGVMRTECLLEGDRRRRRSRCASCTSSRARCCATASRSTSWSPAASATCRGTRRSSAS